jgi:hypothetical protein
LDRTSEEKQYTSTSTQVDQIDRELSLIDALDYVANSQESETGSMLHDQAKASRAASPASAEEEKSALSQAVYTDNVEKGADAAYQSNTSDRV